MRGINKRKNKKKVEAKKNEGYQQKFYIVVVLVTIALVSLVYLTYSNL